MFDSNVASGDARGTGGIGVVTFRSDRDPKSWSSQTLLPVQAVNPFAVFNGALFPWFTPDLSHGILRTGDPGLVGDAPSGVPNLYLTNGIGGSAVLLSASVNPVISGPFNAPGVVDASTDLSHVVFESSQSLTAGAPAQSPSVYEWDHGTVRLVSVLPNGTPADDAVAGTPSGDPVVSDDGARVYFSARSPDGASLLYLRKQGSETAWVSQSEASSPDNSPSTAEFQGASGDGTLGFFETTKHLLDSDTDASNDLYMYTDSASPSLDSNLTLISEDHESGDGTGASVDGVLGVSKDGMVVYFAAENAIVAGQSTQPGTKLYVWDHGTVRFIAPLNSFTESDNWNSVASYRTSRMTGDGRYLVFRTAVPQAAGFDNAGHTEVYRYDRVGQELLCVSCGSGSGPASADASLNFPGAVATREYFAYSPRAISADGSRVFFDTADALVPEDTNGKIDAYEWENGVVHLISSGRGETDSYFVDASANGDDAYFVTRRRLVGWDADTLLDLYDARVGGGLPEPPAARLACTGESCQGGFGVAPDVEVAGSSSVAGSRGLHRSRAHTAAFTIAPPGKQQLARWANGGVLTLRVHVSAPGKVSVRARGRRAQGPHCVVASASRSTRHGGLVRLRLVLSHGAREQLARAGRLRVTLLVRYSRARAVRRVTVTLVDGASTARTVQGGTRCVR